jgi:hypothetical protein
LTTPEVTELRISVPKGVDVSSPRSPLASAMIDYAPAVMVMGNYWESGAFVTDRESLEAARPAHWIVPEAWLSKVHDET